VKSESVLVGRAVLALTMGCGCGGTQAQPNENYEMINQTIATPETSPDPNEQELVEKFKQCARDHARDFKSYSHRIQFLTGLADNGLVGDVEVEESTIKSEKIESCMKNALVGIVIKTDSRLGQLSGPRLDGYRSPRDRPPGSRGAIGVVQVAGAVVALGPIIVIAAGATIAVYLTATTIDAVAKWRQIEKLCTPWLMQCLGDPYQPGWNIDDFGPMKDCQKCYEECKHQKGVWPDYKCPRVGYRPPGQSIN
jgi:hypothetical protein